MTLEMQEKPGFRSGFIAIAGAPNAGKSTLLNHLLGEKISITSKKPQTTRNNIRGVVHREMSQMIFIDTPGVHEAKSPLNVKIVDMAVTAMGDVDTILFMIDASSPDPSSEEILVNKLSKENRPVILALNKIDLIDKQRVLPMIEKWKSLCNFAYIVPVSAKHGTQVEELLQLLEKQMPEGPELFPGDTLTDVTEKFIVAEMVREKAFRLTGQELPYSIAVTVDTYKKKNKIMHIDATIHVERDSQKGIIIGKGATKLKTIGENARADIEKHLGCKVFLKLFVRTQKNWSKDTKALRNFGY